MGFFVYSLPHIVGWLFVDSIMSLNQSQRAELNEYIEELLELYSEDEYENYLENIVYQYCKRKFDIEKEASTKLLYEIIVDLD